MHTNLTNKKIRILIPVFLVLIMLMPVLVGAQGGFIPCGGNIFDDSGNIIGKQPECSFGYLLQLVNNIISWIIKISVPVAAGVFAWAGILYMTTGIAGKKEDAKKMIHKVFIGLVFILSAWIIVTTLTKALLDDEFSKDVPVEGVRPAGTTP